MTNHELIVLRVDKNGKVLAGNQHGQRLREDVGSELCHRVMRASDTKGKPVCTQDCVEELNDDPQTPKSRQVVVRDRMAHLHCERIGDEIVVFAEMGSDEPVEQLTPREREVMQLVVRGMTAKQIATELGINSSTVRTHVEHARRRLGAHTQAEAVGRALRTGQL